MIEFYTTAETILDKMHEHMITLLQKHTPNVKENMKLHIKQLKEEEYYIFFLQVNGKPHKKALA